MWLCGIAVNERQIGDAFLPGLPGKPVQHSYLDVDPDDLASGQDRPAAGRSTRPGPGPISRTRWPGRIPMRSRVFAVPSIPCRPGWSNAQASRVGHGNDHRREARRHPSVTTMRSATSPRSILRIITLFPPGTEPARRQASSSAKNGLTIRPIGIGSPDPVAQLLPAIAVGGDDMLLS